MFVPGIYKITAHTCICGEEQTIRVSCFTEEDRIRYCDEFADENAMEWWDPDYHGEIMTEDEYWADCYCTFELEEAFES